MTVYDTGRDLLSMGVVPLGDMLPEVALAKASWLAGQATPPDKFGTLMATDMAGEMLRRRAVRRR
jgi:glutamyl-tRNA(Gln) amidotransferase subunit D